MHSSSSCFPSKVLGERVDYPLLFLVTPHPPRTACRPHVDAQLYRFKKLSAALACGTPYPNRKSHPCQLSDDESSKSLAVKAMANRIWLLEHWG